MKKAVCRGITYYGMSRVDSLEFMSRGKIMLHPCRLMQSSIGGVAIDMKWNSPIHVSCVAEPKLS